MHWPRNSTMTWLGLWQTHNRENAIPSLCRHADGSPNHPMHRRPRRLPRKWNNHWRGPGDRYRSSNTLAALRRGMLIFLPQFSCPLELRASFLRVVDGFDQPASVPPLSTVTFGLSAERRPQTLRKCLRNPERCSARSCLLTNVRHPFRSQTRGQEPRARKPRASSPWDSVPASDVSSNTTSSGRSGCLPAFHPGTDACQVSRRAVS
jgi:hypothetical protein